MHSTAIDTKDMLVRGSAQSLPSSSLQTRGEQQTNKLQHVGSVVKKKKRRPEVEGWRLTEGGLERLP